jgi:hypothetical protein
VRIYSYYYDGKLVCARCYRALERQEEVLAEKRMAVPEDADLIGVARKYAGIVTKSVIAFELKVPLEAAESVLERFCRHGEVRKAQIGNLTVYHFPGVSAYLGKLPSQIVKMLLDNPTGMNKAQMIDLVDAPIDALDEGLTDLERRGIVARNPLNDTYMLRMAQEAT